MFQDYDAYVMCKFNCVQSDHGLSGGALLTQMKPAEIGHSWHVDIASGCPARLSVCRWHWSVDPSQAFNFN